VVLCFVATAATAALAASTSQRTYSTAGTRPLRTALTDPYHLDGADAGAYNLARKAGAQFVRLNVSWKSVAPAVRPAGFDPSDPTTPGYSWGGLDAAVDAAQAAGLMPILTINAAPQWAYAKKPSGVNDGTPKSAALGAFAKALATHYDGSSGSTVNAFEVWNEPNLSLFLNPVSPAAYRAMVNAVAGAVHAVDPANVVVAGGLAPFGHPLSRRQKWHSVAPLSFMRSLLCVSKGAHPHSTCSGKIHFNVWSHHPYSFGGPFGKAKVPDDVELGDLPRMRAVLQAGVRLHHVASTHPVQFWVTELGWDTSPPRPHAASMALASRWTAEALYQSWRSGVSLVTWFDLQDQPGKSPYQSGLYFHSSTLGARPKKLLTAFRFPFVAYRGASSVGVWGRDASSDKERVTIQLRNGASGSWRTVAYVVSNSNGVFRANLKLHAAKRDWLRAVAAGSGNSLAFSLTVPHYPNIGPWGN
jgi:hypothetical protein